ncbi:adenosylcobinamide-GDP ribazoletransferase [Nocardioides sp. GXQ0305]|uniref:adenosylcobinamide-GDP ribazoletransferase n=1 Tax=Nocardioides sp. GXQ0305 TaxID=3423912 RepID=UPI003D7F04E2
MGTLTVLPVAPPRQPVGGRVAGVAMALAPVAVLPLAVVAGLVVWAGDAVLAPPLLIGALAVAVLALGSGGLHLDGLADTADGLAVPGDVGRRLDVMRSGDVGPVGAATVVLVILLQASAIGGVLDRHTGPDAAIAVGVAVVVSRGCLSIGCARGVPAARVEGLGSAVAGTVPVAGVALVVLALAAVALLLDGGRGLAGVVLVVVSAALVVLTACRRLGGVTGDVLGAVVEVSLTAFLVVQAVGLQ